LTQYIFAVGYSVLAGLSAW